MNGPEKKVVSLSLILLVIGIVVRFLPWGLPSIEMFQVGESLIVANELASNVSAGLPPDGQSQAVGVLSESANLNKLNKFNSRKPHKSVPKVRLPISINSASVDMLCALKGVGPKLAEKIVAYRESKGCFKSAKDLEKVPGIGKKKLEGILPDIIFD